MLNLVKLEWSILIYLLGSGKFRGHLLCKIGRRPTIVINGPFTVVIWQKVSILLVVLLLST